MKLSVFYDHVCEAAQQTGKSVDELLHLCHTWHIDALEVRYSDLLTDPELPRRIADAGLKVSCVYYFYDFGVDQDLTTAMAHLQAAAALGAPRVLIVPGALPMRDAQSLARCAGNAMATFRFMDNHPHTQRMADALSKLVHAANKLGLEVTLEDFDGDTQPFARMYQLKWFMERVPGLRYTLDTGNFAYSDEDVLEAYCLLKNSIVHVHCKDRGEEPDKTWGHVCRGLAPVAVGHGYLPIGKVLKLLKQQGYDGYLAIEHFGSDNQLACIAQSAAYLYPWIN